MEFIKKKTAIDFVGMRHIFTTGSLILLALSLALFFIVGPNYGIDFTGGSEIQFKFDEPITISEVREAIGAAGLPSDAVQQVGKPEENEYIIRVQDASFGSDEIKARVEETLSASFGADWIQEIRFEADVGARMTVVHKGEQVPIEQIAVALAGLDGVSAESSPDIGTFFVKLPGFSSQVENALRSSFAGHTFHVSGVTSVGPAVGKELRTQSIIALIATMTMILIYTAFRFDMTFAPGAVACLVHDALLTVGIFVAFQIEVNVNFVGALLTIVGYSLNDTVVIYDRIRELQKKYRRKDIGQLINDANNEMLGRTIATSFTAFLAVTPFLFIGSQVIRTFALAMCIGIVAGSYSTIYIASPLVMVMQDIRPLIDRLMAFGQRSSPEQAASTGRYSQDGSWRPNRSKTAPHPIAGSDDADGSDDDESKS